jgi:hypothetical protein
MPRYRATLEGVVELTPEEEVELLAQEAIDTAPKAPSILDFDAALTRHLDATAQSRRYDNRITCMVRAGFSGPFQAEAIAFATWCDNCNLVAYTLLAEVQAGVRTLPGDTQALIDSLPPMVWPEQ